ncbi:MAG TPA: hypothetical protein DIU15_09690 [Deltaproteobacteria bacterium]|nr:hypothetical protein [Deltaproteobacteria bacterium]HCP46303.1 hypothetical protein [Deltaproteobacteria bacterium]
MAPATGLELEVAITRAQDLLARGVLRAGSVLTVGNGRSATVTLGGASLPELWSLVRVEQDRASLAFTEAMEVGWAEGDGLKTSQELIDSGVALETSDAAGTAGWQASLAAGGKVIVRFGGLSVLIKARTSGEVPEVAPSMDTPGLCGGCAAALPPPLEVDGSLRPCDACGAVNGPPDPEDVEDSIQTSSEDADEQETELGLGPVAMSLSQAMGDDQAGSNVEPSGGEAEASAGTPRRKRRGKPPWTRLQLGLLAFGFVSGLIGISLILAALLTS